VTSATMLPVIWLNEDVMSEWWLTVKVHSN
jgi:hypothetical protein